MMILRMPILAGALAPLGDVSSPETKTIVYSMRIECHSIRTAGSLT